MRHFYCSSFSKGYAYKGLLLYESLLRWDKDFHFFMICLHPEVEELFAKMRLKNATLISLSAIERQDQDLLGVKGGRNEKEYAWTLKASAMLYIFDNFQETDHIVWLDGDTYFYSDPAPIFSEWGNQSIVLTEEKWSDANKKRRLTRGIFNTGFMGFKRNEEARRCLSWFRKKLIAWCYDRMEEGLWSDQLYVNDWPTRFKAGVIENIGVNVGPCIIRDCEVTKQNGQIYVNGEKLIFYHSYGFRYFDGNEFDLCSYIMSFADNVIEWIYLPYIDSCLEMMARIRQVDKDFYPTARPSHQFIRNYYNLAANTGGLGRGPHICTLLTKDYLVQGLVLYNSLRQTTPEFHLWVLCVDNTAYNLLAKMHLPNVTLVSLENVKNERLAALQGQRKINEFCWTLKASFVTYLLKNNLNLDSMLYVDADLYFFRDVKSIYQEWGDKSVFLTKLWLGPKWAKRVGAFSAGLIGFKRNRHGRRCLNSWRRRCLKWCSEKPEKGRWADQKYLDRWPGITDSIAVSANKGINTGPWNIRKGYIVEEKNHALTFENAPLVCYHFSGFELISEREVELCNRKRLPAHAEIIYAAYLEEIKEVISQVKAVDANFLPGILKKKDPAALFNYRRLQEYP